MAYQRKTKKRGRQGEGGGAPKKWTDEVIAQYADKLLAWYRAKKNRIWLKDFAIENDFPSANFSDWERKSPKFSEALKKAKDIQEQRLIALAIQLSRGKSKPAFAIFALKNVAGWRDTQDVHMSVSGLVKFVEDIPA